MKVKRTKRHSAKRGQAIIEMAMVFWITLVLIFNFIAVMITVVQQEITSAVASAANSAVEAPAGNPAVALAYANCSFSGQSNPSLGSNCPYTGSFTPPGFITLTSGLTCSGLNLNQSNSSTVTCKAAANINFMATPLGALVFWSIPISGTATVSPSQYRACPTC